MDGQSATPIEDISNQGASTMTPGAGDASLEQRPAEPSQGQPMAARLPVNAPQAQQQAQPQAPPSPADTHAGIFKHTLSLLSGGMNRPVMGPDGKPVTDANGQVQMQPASAKQLGAGILAGAIASMVAGMAAPTQYKQFGEGRGARQVADNGASVAAGAAAAQPFTQEGSQKKAQGEADDQRGRAMGIMDHNLKFRTMSLAADKANREGQQDVVDAHETMRDAMQDAFTKGAVTDETGNPIELWKSQDISGTEVQKLMVDKTLGITRDMIIPTRVIEVPNEDGTGSHPETLFSVYNPKAVVKMSDSLRKDPAYSQLSGVANGTPLPVRVLASISMNSSNEKLASNALDGHVSGYNDAVKGSKIPAIKDGFDLAAAAKSDPMIKKLYPYIAKYASDPMDAFFKDLKSDPTVSKNPTLQAASAKLMQAMGVTSDGLEKMKIDRTTQELAAKDKELEAKSAANEAAKEKSPAGQLALEKTRLEVQGLRQANAQTEANKAGITPPGFIPVPNSNEIESAPLQQALAAKGVKIPTDFEALYKIAHGEADINTYTNNPRAKTGLMPRSQAMTWVSMINPNWQEADYKANANLTKSIRDTKVGTAGGTLLASGVASNHLDLLGQYGKALKNNDVQVINSIKQKYGIATGEPNAVVFKAIGQKLNEEVEKVTSGGQPQVAALKEAQENLNVAESPEQITGVINAYVGLMNGRTSEIDAQAYRYTGRHIGVSPNVAKIYNAAGYKVPGQPDVGSKPVIRNNEIIGWSSPDGKSMVQVPQYR